MSSLQEKTFGEYARDCRISIEMTLRHASRLSGIPVTRLSQIETNRAETIQASEMMALARAYSLTDPKTFEKLFMDYGPDREAIERDVVIREALAKGTPPDEMAARFGVLICKATQDDVEDFRELCEVAARD